VPASGGSSRGWSGARGGPSPPSTGNRITRRGPELERASLLKIEEGDRRLGLFDPTSLNVEPVVIGHHVMLLTERRYVAAIDLSTDGERYGWHAKRLTAAGHEYSDIFGYEEVWRNKREGQTRTCLFGN
jgi:hypothetical protein